MTINSGNATPIGEDDMKAQRHHHLRPRGEKINHDASRPNLPSVLKGRDRSTLDGHPGVDRAASDICALIL
jgi:hypothetical protein